MNDVAAGVADLTPAWLSHALGVEIRRVDAQQIGDGQTGASYRLALDTETGPSSVVAKLAAGEEAARQRVARGYRNEVGFYTQLLGTVAIRSPQCWYGAITGDALAFTLLLEDLAPRTPGVQADGCTIDQADDAVRNLAALHASRWNDDTLFDLDFLDRLTERGAERLGGILAAATDEFLARYRDELEPSDLTTLRAAADAIVAWQLARPEPFAVVHGDYRLDNLMFPPDGHDVAALDWQTVSVGPPARDLAYFLGTSLHVEDRRAAEHDLVASYHRELVGRGVDAYDPAQCFDDYRLGQLQGPLITVIGCVYSPAARTDRADQMFLAMIRRSCAAIRDLDSIEAIGSEAGRGVDPTPGHS